MTTTTDVIVVGAGPTGLLLAGDLARAGVGVTLIERRDTESNLTRAFAVHARTLEELDARGVADELLATGAHVPGMRMFGHVQVELSGLASRYPFVLITPQYEVEKVLEKRALAAGAVIERGVRLIGLRQDPEGVDIEVAIGDRITRRRASYVVGTDGLHSMVRQQIGVEFPGESVLTSMMLADVRLDSAPDALLTADSTEDGFVFVVPFGDGWWRVMAWDRERQLPDSEPVDFGEFGDLVRKVMGTDYGMREPRFLSRFHADERQAPSYRVGRVFLAGDAAHIHSPAGGQGMNTGLQDAANLAWKLAAAVQGWAPSGLLDSYQSERHPVGEQVLKGSGSLLKLALLKSDAARTVRNAVASVAATIPPLVRRAAGMLSGVAISYEAPKGAHKLVGHRAPDLAVSGGRLYEALREGRHVLVLGPEAPEPEDAGRAVVVRAVEETPALLVRPDAYIAWAGDASDVREGLVGSGLI